MLTLCIEFNLSEWTRKRTLCYLSLSKTRLTGFLGAAFDRVDLVTTGVLTNSAMYDCDLGVSRLRVCMALSRDFRSTFSFSSWPLSTANRT